uniref:Serpentine receptor class gamma n=1 Tax=Caenorhabditis tropicalis TaxID=1561998 RepID=A0A1I7TUS6_9PELO
MTQKTVRFSLKTSYLAFLITISLFGTLAVFSAQSKLKFDPIFVAYYSILNLLLIISAILNIPIFISVRRYAHLASAMSNQPQKYIFLQIVFTVLFKSALIFQITEYVYSKNMSLATLTVFSVLNDNLTNPLTVQLSYIFCNKRNVQVLRSKILRILCRTGSHVNPVASIAISTVS